MFFRSTLTASTLLLLASSALAAVVVRSLSDPVGSIDLRSSRDLVPADSTQIEGRQVADIASSTLQLVNSILDGIAKDKQRRGQFTQDFVDQAHKDHPQFNWVIVHPKHTTKFEGKQGTDWDHAHKEFDVDVGGTVGYEIYNFKGGEFTLQGDGGYINWAFTGVVKTRDQDGKHIIFAKPS